MKFNCLMCSGINYIEVKNKVRDSNEYKVVKCIKCGHHQINPIPSIEEDEEYYHQDIQLDEMHKNLDIIHVRNKVRDEMVRRKNDIDHIVDKDSKILEIGSGYGVFLEIMENEGYIIEGVEISSKRRDISRQFCSSKIFDMNLLSDEIPEMMKGKYDVIVLFHVLEHISEPHKFLCKIKKMLKKGGSIVIEVPNINDHMLNINEKYNEFFYLRAHVSYFSKEILEKLLLDNDYKDVNTKGIQRYSIKNTMHWLINGKPQAEKPTFGLKDDLKWVDDFYKEELCKKYKSDTILVFAKRL